MAAPVAMPAKPIFEIKNIFSESIEKKIALEFN